MRNYARLAPLVLTIACASAAFAQQSLATISGHLVDPNNKVVTGLETVTIALKNVKTGAVVSVGVNRDGSFQAKDVAPGTYDVEVPIPCCMYARYQQKALSVAPGQALRVDFHIGWGMNLGTIGDDPVMLGADMRAKTKNPNAPTPRTADGKPDLSGVWANIADPNMTRPRIPMKPWAAEIQMKLQATNSEQNPGAFCLPQMAIPSQGSFPYKFIQTPTEIVQLTEFVTPGHRQIFMDGRKHPDPEDWNPAWYGHSIGWWEGDTLVVDTVGFNEITPGFAVHSEKLHTVERYRRVNYGTLEVEVRAEDPDAWTAPYTFKFTAGLAEGEEILEWVCAENNKDPAHFGGLGWKGRP